jgi:hypothetical protein
MSTPAEPASAPGAATPAQPEPPAEAKTPAEPPAPAEAGPARTKAAPADIPPTDKAGETVSLTTDITPGPGGVMTDEAGVVTGDLTLRSDLTGKQLTLHVQYREADEWYVVTGGKGTLESPADLAAVHQIVVGILHRPEG